MRLVLDSNVLVSGLISHSGAPAGLLHAWSIEEAFRLVTSVEQLDELDRISRYDRLRNRLRPERMQTLRQTIDELADLVEPQPGIDLSPDPDDNRIIGIAFAGCAHYIVSGDKKDLLELDSAGDIPVVSARRALGIIHHTEEGI